MHSDPSEWLPIDPDSPSDSPLFQGSAEGQARVVAVVADRSVGRDDWAARATVGLARECSRRFGRVLLADLHMTRPRLHHVLGVENGEGVSDIFIWGASLQRVARPVKAGFLFAPAGTVIADQEAVVVNPRWESLLEGFDRAGATLVLSLPPDLAEIGLLLGRATDVVILADPDSVPEGVVGAAGTKLRALHGPREPRDGAVRPEGEAAVSGEDDAPLPDYEAEEWEKDVAAVVSEAEGLRSRLVPIALVFVLVVVILLVLAWTGLVSIPGLTPLLRGAGIEGGPVAHSALSVVASLARRPAE